MSMLVYNTPHTLAQDLAAMVPLACQYREERWLNANRHVLYNLYPALSLVLSVATDKDIHHLYTLVKIYRNRKSNVKYYYMYVFS